MNIAALLVTIFKGSQALRDIFEGAVDLWYAEENRQDQNQMNWINQEREGILAALKQPGMTDENRRALRKRLIALSRL
jgi:hypothetical protein